MSLVAELEYARMHWIEELAMQRFFGGMGRDIAAIRARLAELDREQAECAGKPDLGRRGVAR